jgi:hypothetical protein
MLESFVGWTKAPDKAVAVGQKLLPPCGALPSVKVLLNGDYCFFFKSRYSLK